MVDSLFANGGIRDAYIRVEEMCKIKQRVFLMGDGKKVCILSTTALFVAYILALDCLGTEENMEA